MADKQAQQLKQPEQPKKEAPKIEARMFVMPQQYRHGAEGVMHQPETAKPAQPKIEVQAPAVPAPKAPPKPVAAPKKKKASPTKWILIIGIVLMLLLGAGGYLVVMSLNPEPEVKVDPDPEIEEPITRPEPDSDPDEDLDEDPVEEPVKDPFGGVVTPGTDTDSDGLTDIEEEVVYETDPRLPDSDADGFLDGNEVFHRYNPNGTAPGTLLASGLVTMLWAQAGDAYYELNYPTIWDVESTEQEIVLDATTGEGFRLSYLTKSTNETLEDWAEELLSDELTFGVTKNGLVAGQTDDQLTNYVDLGSVVLIFTYDTGTKGRVDYLQTYQMMLNSVVILTEEDAQARELVETPEFVTEEDESSQEEETEETSEDVPEEVTTDTTEEEIDVDQVATESEEETSEEASEEEDTESTTTTTTTDEEAQE